MKTWVLCALLTMAQQNAVCWQVRTHDKTCDRLMHAWFMQAAIFYQNNPDLVPTPQLSCGEDGGLPPGAVWYGSQPTLPTMGVPDGQGR